jgi:hypothetical protein
MLNEIIIKLIEIVVWPSAFIIIVVAFFFIFKQPLSKLISRIKEVSKKGIKTISESPQKLVETDQAAVDELMQAFDSIVLRDIEKTLRQNLDDKGLTEGSEREKVLIRHLAASQIQTLFERIYGVIFGSQIELLKHLNSSSIPVNPGDLKIYYDYARTDYPTFYKDYSFEHWLNFLTAHTLVIKEEEGYKITNLGRELLAYLVVTGRTGFRLY